MFPLRLNLLVHPEVAQRVPSISYRRGNSLRMPEKLCDPNKTGPWLGTILSNLNSSNLVATHVISHTVGYYDGDESFELKIKAKSTTWPVFPL